MATLLTPYQPYSLKLRPYYRGPGPVSGAYIRASINGSPPLRLLLDTGAQNLVLKAKAAEKLDLEFLSESALAGFGRGSVTTARTYLARSVRIDDLELGNCQLQVAAGSFSLEVDGVIGPVIFEKFLVHVNVAGQTLDLEPFTASASPQTRAAARPSHTLLVPAVAAGIGSGYFLLDTGAAVSLVSDQLPGTLGQQLDRPGLLLRGASGELAVRMTGPLRFRTGGQQLLDREAAVADLGVLSSREGIDVAGVIGFGALSRTVVSIDYRNGLVRLGSGAQVAARR